MTQPSPGGRSRLAAPHPSNEHECLYVLQSLPQASATTAFVDLSSPKERQANSRQMTPPGEEDQIGSQVQDVHESSLRQVTREASLGRRHCRGILGEWQTGRTQFLALGDNTQKPQPKMAMSLAMRGNKGVIYRGEV